jgi:RNA polymerase sigma-70 factor (ECF subfamily)
MRVLPIRTQSAPAPSTGTPQTLGDAELVERVRRGDTSAAGILYDRLRPVIDFALRRVLRGRTDALQDLAHDTFEQILRALANDRFEGRSSLTTWAAAIAGHVALDRLRRTLRETSVLVDVEGESVAPAAGVPGAERRIEARSEVRRLQGILARMKPELAETLLLHEVLGHDLAEIAEITGVSLSACQSRLFRGRKELLRRAGAQVPQGDSRETE